MELNFVIFCGLLAVAGTLCRAASNTGRIVGGNDAAVGQSPFQVSLQRDDGTHECGGSILNERYILTAAHCVVVGAGIQPYPPHFLKVRVGSIQVNAGGKLLSLKHIIVNKNYGRLLNDVALLELEQPLQFTDNIKPIEMADSNVPSGEDVIFSGWGRLYSSGPHAQRMQWNTLKSLSKAECDEDIGFGFDNMLCLAHEVKNGVCNGDSGGPAIHQNKLVGVAGFVVNGCGTKNADGFANVFYHREWIESNMAL